MYTWHLYTAVRDICMELQSHVEHNEPFNLGVSSHQFPAVQVIDFHALKLQHNAMVALNP